MRVPFVVSGTLILVTAAACSSDPMQPEPGESFTLEPGQTVDIPAAQARLTFVDVPEDSRCPTRVECPWEGDGSVRLTLDPESGDAWQPVLHTTLEPEAVSVGEVTLRLLVLTPYPESPGEIPADDYRATFILETAEH